MQGGAGQVRGRCGGQGTVGGLNGVVLGAQAGARGVSGCSNRGGRRASAQARKRAGEVSRRGVQAVVQRTFLWYWGSSSSGLRARSTSWRSGGPALRGCCACACCATWSLHSSASLAFITACAQGGAVGIAWVVARGGRGPTRWLSEGRGGVVKGEEV